MEYCVNVRRIFREDTNVYVDANSPEEAAEKAKLEVMNREAIESTQQNTYGLFSTAPSNLVLTLRTWEPAMSLSSLARASTLG